ncbi:MAG: N-acetyl-gamma-glutamyl-phosphate reductase [Acidobacteriota bacterium]|jgi:N-acetyl-gamma-glutamyl-phosphate reductase (EC 1.2.1.38)/N2-acetyl-L-aminoadipate semialdehyde dehydrogenase (EC 1.2.1.-)|nr:N-acetyl-gamma-glutamyl-phosphate reductase [Acidobacteriota bacterium]HNQ81738.1 N-acetyl-gamma-glutamyl-phosphate reductase [Candidatus Aminicenantes bacterium]MDD8029413.1 N-acetyl-gamma-glutamyl-phosphate reductase [Acidobacteriota bacterium]MDD8032926.1 N-acetyl-gamma-glutamyl-phosphate reductase [Acidobacteriota bacterium]MDD8037717.1 N-acetyl-gamma-glutamyl-phosphate reductase [Acidobacteriota bacterium]
MGTIRAAIVGASGYAGGELLRLLLFHENVEVVRATSERNAGLPVTRRHPNLRKITGLCFSSSSELNECDLIFLCLPHGEGIKNIDHFMNQAPKIIDLSADFRLKRSEDRVKWYGSGHPRPELVNQFVYGIPELHREEMKKASYISSAGCNATVSILALYPLFKQGAVEKGKTVIEVKAGSSEGGRSPSEYSHHPERSGCVRTYQPTSHRHKAEIIQELGLGENDVHFSATSIDMVRGILATCHVFLEEKLGEKEIWKIFREHYAGEPFIRIVKERSGGYRYPEPKILAGTNFCDIGFEQDPDSNRLVVISAIDNLMKGAAGQAVQAMNIMCGFPENRGLEFCGLHPA